MDAADATELVEAIPEFDEIEWHRQMRLAFASSTAYPVQNPKGKMLWLVVRRSLLMVISAFDQAYGIETKKR